MWFDPKTITKTQDEPPANLANLLITAEKKGVASLEISKLAELADPQTAKTSPALDLEGFQERAGILEFEAGVSRPQAEFMARCDQCRHFSRFGNCRMPQEAGISVRFELIQAPGPACQIFEAKPPPAPY
ncbi:hypothetical protein [Ferrovum myxofaciens]|uniref:hypothetical protein n=1 Tax=Ferrovum myxofaciens TaxID=416213 RepID=UPI00235486C5|nr:hypothetical protein [Ferrovum myxofaciens]MBU6995604.1 hypothetical protein [Ferrovum myxofaciens]